MPEISRHEPGSFCWIELGTNDAKAAKAFYGGLFKWSFQDDPAGPDSVYTTAKLRDREVGGLYQRDADQKNRGVPPRWLAYLAVQSADETAAAAKSLGASLQMEPFDVMDLGRMALLDDPQGAPFALWQAKSHPGSRLVNEFGSYGWVELGTNDVPAAIRFYTKVLGWETKVGPVGGIPYTQWKLGPGYAGGCRRLEPAWGITTPHWLVYFRVEDANAAAVTVAARGGRVLAPPHDLEGIGRYAVFADPQEAVFAVIELKR